MRLRLLSLALALGLVSTLIAAPLASAAPPTGTGTNPFTNIPVTGTIANGGGTFAGTLNVTQFAVQNRQLVALGNLSGTLTNTTGGTIGMVSNVPVTLPVDPSGSCQVLDLTLGPLNLNLLGLVVTLNQVHLNITAQQGSGNLLGNLLCAVTNLLNNPGNGSINGVANLLNRILAIL
jgi:hypothetical protein